MKPQVRHDWNVSPDRAQEIQGDLVRRVIRSWDGRPVHTVAGLDVGFPGGKSRAAVAALSFPELQLVDSAQAIMDVSFPYIPGLLAFREGPVILAALERLRVDPDLLIFDGQGLAHPRRMGIATHMGVVLDVPSIGCAKSRLVGKYEEPAPSRGAYRWLCDGDEIIGAILRTRGGVSPVFVSIGHRIDLDSAVDFVLRCCTRYRLPEPIRWAHRLASGEGPPQGRQLPLV